MTTERRVMHRDDAAALIEWGHKQWEIAVEERLKPLLLAWALAPEADKPEAMARYKAAVELVHLDVMARYTEKANALAFRASDEDEVG